MKTYTTYYYAQGDDAEQALEDFQDLSGEAFVDHYGENAGETTSKEPWGEGDDIYDMGLWIVSVNWGIPYISLTKRNY